MSAVSNRSLDTAEEEIEDGLQQNTPHFNHDLLTGTAFNFAFRNLIGFRAYSADATTSWTRAVWGSAARWAEYLSREVTCTVGGTNARSFPVPVGVIMWGHSNFGHRAWMALPTQMVETIAARLRGQVVFGAALVEGEDLAALPGYTAFPTYLTYIRKEDGQRYWEDVEIYAPDGALLSADDFAQIENMPLDPSAFFTAEVEFKVTACYRGKPVREDEWQDAPMCLRLNPRVIRLSAGGPPLSALANWEWRGFSGDTEKHRSAATSVFSPAAL